MSNPNTKDNQAGSNGQKRFWLWLLAAVMAVALLFEVVRWVVGGHG